MKKLIFITMLVFSFALTSCKSEKKDTKQTNSKEVVTQLYQCPMDCEKGKSYTEKGSCPVCKMSLTAKKTDNHEGHSH